jgi:two-component system sensor histidine kinase TctE
VLTNRLHPQLLAGLLVPLGIFALVQFSVAYRTAGITAQVVTDRILLASAHSIAENIESGENGIEAIVPPSALGMFDLGYGDSVYYRVSRADGRLLAGYIDLQTPHAPAVGGQPRYYDATYRAGPVRLVAVTQPVPGRRGVQDAIVIVAETLNGRNAMSRQLWLGSAVQQFLLVAFAGTLAWFGLQRILAPLIQLSNEVREREPDEYAPFAVAALQAELDPLVNALNGYMLRLQSQLDAQRRFTANAAHQLRTPLALLRTQATYALRTTNELDRADATRGILTTTLQITRLTNQLLSLAKAEPHGQPLRRGQVDLVPVTREILEEYGRLAVDRSVDLAFEVKGHGAIVNADRALLRDLVVNLVDNAIRYTPVGGHVVVTVEREHLQCVLRVEDTGPGVPASKRALVFERFYRVAGRDSEGSGLGLAIVKEIVDAHQGAINLRDRARGSGLIVEVCLPACDLGAALGADIAERGWPPLQTAIPGPR